MLRITINLAQIRAILNQQNEVNVLQTYSVRCSESYLSRFPLTIWSGEFKRIASQAYLALNSKILLLLMYSYIIQLTLLSHCGLINQLSGASYISPVLYTQGTFINIQIKNSNKNLSSATTTLLYNSVHLTNVN